MINVKNLQRNKLGTPPSEEDIKNNLHARDSIKRAPTHRTQQLCTKIRPELYDKIRMLAAQDRLKIADIIEKAIVLYEQSRPHGNDS